jgi:hypothetical protein
VNLVGIESFLRTRRARDQAHNRNHVRAADEVGMERFKLRRRLIKMSLLKTSDDGD